MGKISEELLLALAVKNSGGGGGTTNYNDLSNQPQINGVTLSGDKSASDLSLASLDANGKVPAAQLPSYVDDVINGYLYECHFYEDSAHTTEITGESGKIYIDLETNKTYRWSGIVFAEISESLALGETASTAYAGDKGKANADAIAAIKDGQIIDSFADVESALADKVDKAAGKGLSTNDYTDADKAIVGGVTAALANKQDALTAGDYIDITSGEISVNREIPPNNYTYEIVTKSIGNDDASMTVKKYANGSLVSSTDYLYTNVTTAVNIDNYLTLQYANGWKYTLLQASTDHASGYVATWGYQTVVDYTEAFPTEDTSGLKLIIKSELDTALATKQNATDNNLETTAKNIVGAINEHEGDVESLKSGFTNLDNEVNGDAVEYPYADVITIEDAVPANLADCTVKIEPVQDLHGYNHPWVGGANKNKINIADKASSTSGDVTASCSNGVITLSGTASAQTTFSFPLGSDINLTPSLYKIAYNNTAASSYIAVKFCNNGSVIHSWTPNVVNRVISDWTAAEDETIDEIKIEIATGYPTNMTLSIVVMDKDGTDASFSPFENICPISGHTEAKVQRDGKNLCSELESGTLNEYGMNTARNERVRTKYYIRVVEGQQYVVSALPSVSGKVVNIAFNGFAKDDYATHRIYDSGWLTSGSYITIPSGVKFVRCVFRYKTDENITPSSFEDVQLELGSTATPYEPYQGKTYTIALGSTIYGGTVDFDSGVMTVTKKCVDLGAQTWDKSDEMYYRFYTTISDMYKISSSSVVPDFICSNYAAVSAADQYNNGTLGIAQQGNTLKLLIRDTRYSSKEDFSAAVSGVQLVYPLATPLTIQLTPQQIQLLKGTNTLTASTGQISITVNGVSGSIGAVQEQVNELAEEIANVKPVNYSTTPQKTGQKWIDGKDVYIVVLPFDATNGSASIDVTSLNIDIAFCVGCFCQEEIYQTYNLAITQLYNTSDDKFTFQLNGARTAINVSVGNEKKGHGAIILCYTNK